MIEKINLQLIDDHSFIENGQKLEHIKTYEGYFGFIIGVILCIVNKAFILPEDNGVPRIYKLNSARHLLTRLDREKYPENDLNTKNVDFIKKALIEIKKEKRFNFRYYFKAKINQPEKVKADENKTVSNIEKKIDEKKLK